MKFKIYYFFSIFLMLSLYSCGNDLIEEYNSSIDALDPNPSKKVEISPRFEIYTTSPLYRLYHKGAGNTFYTSSFPEALHYIERNGYNWDSGKDSHHVIGHVFTRYFSGTVPLYRLWRNSSKNSFYTTSYAEAMHYIDNQGYQWDYGKDTHYIIGHVYKDYEAGKHYQEGIKPLYRLWIKKGDNSFYTGSIDEANYYRNTYGYVWDYGYNSHYIQGYLLNGSPW